MTPFTEKANLISASNDDARQGVHNQSPSEPSKVETGAPEPVLRGADLYREIGYWKIIAEDFRTHKSDPFSAGFQAVFWYRFGCWGDQLRFKPFRWPVAAIYYFFQRFVQNVYGIELVRSARLGRRIELAHQHGIVIHHLATIGDDVIIRHNVTFGVGIDWTWKGPIIGNRVSFGPGTVVVGDVTIGDDVTIGPNCTITTDVPSGRTLFVPPPRSLPKAAPKPSPSNDDDNPK